MAVLSGRGLALKLPDPARATPVRSATGAAWKYVDDVSLPRPIGLLEEQTSGLTFDDMR